MTLNSVKEQLKNKLLDESFKSVYTKEQFDLQYERFLKVAHPQSGCS